MKGRNIENQSLAIFLEQNVDKGNIISEIFDFFSIDCIERQYIDSAELDSLIADFENSSACDISILESIIACVRSGHEKSKKQKNLLIQSIISFINENLDSDISIEEIARKLNVSYYYMCHIFKNKYNISPNTYRTQKRLSTAVISLMNGKEKISDIAVSCGFNNISYFTETFTKSFGVSPSVFRTKYAHICFHKFFEFDDILAVIKMENIKFLNSEPKTISDGFRRVSIHEPDDKFQFLHEAAIIEHHGVLYASWYQCTQNELVGYTPICGKRSYDSGETWSELEILCEDKSEKILYCPPVYGICDDKLYMLVNQMVAPDHIHSLDLYLLNEESGKFEFVWTRPIPFKLNTNVVHLANGKLMLPGRIGALDGFPNTPTVMISDDGKIDTEWRLVTIAENGSLPYGNEFIHPEISVICEENILYMFCRDSAFHIPIIYISKDFGESWSGVVSHDIPVMRTKIYSGDLSDGRHYVIANTDRPDRSKLSIYFTDGRGVNFTKQIILFDAEKEADVKQMHYPAAYEYDGKLYVVATKSYGKGDRGAELFIIDLKKV